jgi:hypothetical protein
LSSRSTKSAAARATSVPAQPHAHADVRSSQGWRIVESVSGHGDDLTIQAQEVDDSVLLRGRNASEDLGIANELLALVLRHASEPISRDDGVVVMNDPGALCDGVSREGVIPCHDLDANACGLTLRDGSRDFGAQGVAKAQEPHDRELTFVFFSRAVRNQWADPLCHGQHANARPSQPRVSIFNERPFVCGHRRVLEDPFERASPTHEKKDRSTQAHVRRPDDAERDTPHREPEAEGARRTPFWRGREGALGFVRH